MDLKLFIALNRTMLHIERKSVELFRRHNLTKGQFAVLEILYHKGDLTSKVIKEKILMSPGNLPVIIKNLEKHGFIEKHEDPSDRRFQILSLTDSGREKIEEVFPENEKMINSLFSVWNEDEKEELIYMLKKYRKEWLKDE